MLTTAFSSFGVVQNVKLVRDKGGIDAASVPALLCIMVYVHPPVVNVMLPAKLRNVHTVDAVAYIKFEKASCAARAIEVMHEAVLNEGRGPLLKVFLAEAPTSR